MNNNNMTLVIISEAKKVYRYLTILQVQKNKQSVMFFLV